MTTITCHAACLTCSAAAFFNCTSCAAPLELSNGSCYSPVNYAVQLASTIVLLMFVIPQMLHIRRFLTLSFVFDMVQVVAYFKYLTAYDANRNLYMMLSGRGWGTWSQGWNLIGMDTGVGIWTSEEGDIDKVVRIVCYFGGVMVLTFILGLIKMATGEQGVTLGEYWRKNWLNSLMLGVYINVQDMSFIVANKFYFRYSQLLDVSTTTKIIDLTIALIFALVLIAVLLTLTYIINTMPLNNTGQCFYHANMFLFNFEEELFPNYYQLEHPNYDEQLPKQPKEIKPSKSNLRIGWFMLKMIYPFIVADTLSGSDDQIMPVVGFILFWVVMTWTCMPFRPKQEWSQILIVVLTHVITIGLVYLYGEGMLSDIIIMAFMFGYIGLGLASLLIEIFYSYYKLLPVDLYNTGMKINISVGDPALQRQRRLLEEQKKRLEEQLKRKEQQARKRMADMTEEERRLEQLRLQQQKKLEDEIERLRRQMEQESDKQKRKLLEAQQQALLERHNDNMTEDQAALQAKKADLANRIRNKYRVDASKLNPYEWDRKKKFVYSSKMSRT